MLQYSSQNDHGVRPQNIDHGIATELVQMVRADDCIIMSFPEIVGAGFELDQVINMSPTVSRPIHAAHDATEWKSTLRVAASQLLEDL